MENSPAAISLNGQELTRSVWNNLKAPCTLQNQGKTLLRGEMKVENVYAASL